MVRIMETTDITVSSRKTEDSKDNWGDLKAISNNEHIALEIYSDEIWQVKLNSDNSVWIYLGALFVPVDAKLDYMKLLNDLRCIKHCDWNNNKDLCLHPCGYHDKNDTEIHFKELDRSNARFRIAKNWIDVIKKVRIGDNKKIYLNILGLNLSNMDLELFGTNKNNDMAIYNRFYRTVLLSGLNYFFKKFNRIVVNKIYHDKGGQSSDVLFPWHSISKINLGNQRISIVDKNIEFLDSDHRISGKDESIFIQLVDLVLGATYFCLHNPSSANNKIEIGRAIRPILEVLLDRKRSEYNNAFIGKYYESKYRRTYQISFFPRNKINLDSDLKQLDVLGNSQNESSSRDNFYFNRDLLLDHTTQTGLDRWLV